MIGIGLCDHGTAGGLYKFITKAQKAGIIPVPGVEFYLAPENPEGAKKRGPIYYGEGGVKAADYDISNGAYTHITIFAYNNKGLENLFKLTSISWKSENFYFKPRIDMNMIAEHSEGLIVTSGCPGSEINKRFMLGQDNKAYEFAGRLKSLFGENFYIELMDHKMPGEDLERILLPKLIKLSRDLDIPLIATNDSHYAYKEDAEPHERILAMQTSAKMKEPPKHEGGNRFAFSSEEYHVKTYDEMREIFKGELGAEALANTERLTRKCEGIKLEYDPHLRPELEIPEGFTPPTYLQKLIYEGFVKKRNGDSEGVQAESVKRIKEEFEVIHSNDFISYFLVVHDYIDFAHKKGIGVGAGRGCFVPGSKVKLDNVYKNIEDVIIGDKVQTHDKTYQSVEDVFVYDVVDEDMIKITLSNGKEIKSTADHLIFHKSKGFIPAEEFIINDSILSPLCNIGDLVLTKEHNYYEDIEFAHDKGTFISHRQDKMEIKYSNNLEFLVLTNLETNSQLKSFDKCNDKIEYINSNGSTKICSPNFKMIDKDGHEGLILITSEINFNANWKQEEILSFLDYCRINSMDGMVVTEKSLSEMYKSQYNNIKVTEIEKYKYTGQVHDIQVANVHNYNVEGVTVHNSIGGSEIAYVLDISNTDPIRFDLLFERFLSPGRGSLYQIDYVSNDVEEIAVSDRKRVYSSDGTNKVVYVHELSPGDVVNFGERKEVIKDVFVKRPGAAPDVDTDFHTQGREEVVQYCIDKYGKENVANIITFGTFKAKRAFKAMCTIHDIPFALANKASGFIPSGQGAETSLEDLINPDSPRYNEGIDFRNAVDSPMFGDLVEVASKLDGRISETGVHPCGVIISNTPLAGIIPTQVRQDDGKVITQWEYPELEALGLIKMDFLGLELIDTVQQTLENIKLTNDSAQKPKYIREIPDIDKLIKGPMDDSATYRNLREGNTVGIFQLGSPGVRDLLKRAQPTEFMDIATITALYRPGPMSMQSHNEWADRKNGVKEVVYIHEDLGKTVIKDILQDTQGLLVFQESLMQIATKYAGMSSYESDLLRKAMGKKKIDIMMSMKPKFIEGAIKNNSTRKLAENVWETMEGFASYGFNKSHSVSYALNIYQSIYLKTHYPNEFMAALIQQGFGDPEKVRSYIQEAMRMKLRLGPVDINSSQVKMASTGISPGRKYDVVFGFSAVKQLNDEIATMIVKERNDNGLYTSVADFIKRFAKHTPLTASPITNLALAGAFDEFGVSRKLVAEKASMLINSGNKQEAKGLSLFDMMGSSQADITGSIEIEGEDYAFNEMIKLEASIIGMFISGHPTSKLGHISKIYNPTDIIKINNSEQGSTYNVLGTITQMNSKTNKSGNRSIAILIDDGTDTITSYLPKEIVQGIMKYEELQRIAKAEEKNEMDTFKPNEKIQHLLEDDFVIPVDPIELNSPYIFKVKSINRGGTINVGVLEIKNLYPAKDGSLPFEINITNKAMLTRVYTVIKEHEDKDGAFVRIHSGNIQSDVEMRVKLSLDFIMDIEKAVGKKNVITEGI